MLTVGLTNVFASPDPDPDQKVIDGFKKEFPAAREVSWSNQDEYEKAIFLLAGRRVIAYFSSEGELEGCIRDIFYDQLPLAVMSAVEKRFGEMEVLYVREVTNREGTSYKIRLDEGKKMYNVTVASDGYINDVQKLHKIKN